MKIRGLELQMTMQKRFFLLVAIIICSKAPLVSHCQMPCGIYHDDMVYDQVEQYIETMYKAMSELNHLELTKVKDSNQFVRWVMLKDKESDNVAHLLTIYFLQQKIKPGEQDTTPRLISLHKLLFLSVQIKQNTDLSCVKQFKDEWDNFKLMFHRKGYACEMEKRSLQEEEELRKAKEAEMKKTGSPKGF